MDAHLNLNSRFNDQMEKYEQLAFRSGQNFVPVVFSSI